MWRHFDEPAARKKSLYECKICQAILNPYCSTTYSETRPFYWVTMYVFKYSVSSMASNYVFAEDKGWSRCWCVIVTLPAVVMITAIVHLQEVVLPLYSLWILIVIKYLVPNPNFPVMSTPQGEADLFEHFHLYKNHTIAIVPNTTETQVSTSHIIYQRTETHGSCVSHVFKW